MGFIPLDILLLKGGMIYYIMNQCMLLTILKIFKMLFIF